jgi:hypothetical protein
MRHSLTATILVLALVAQCGCTSGRSGRNSAPVGLPPPPGEAVRSGLGKIAVTSGRFAPTFDIVGGPTKGAGEGASAGAGQGAKLGALAVYGGTFVLGPFAILLIPLIAVGAAVGAIAGASSAEPAVKVEEREATAASQVVAAQRIQDDFRDRVTAVGRAQTPHTLSVLADRGPSAAGERPDYRPLSQEGIQTVVEVGVESVTLEGSGRTIDPPLWLVMTVNTRLVRTVDNAEVYANSLIYTGEKGRTLAEWVGGPESFRDELHRAYAILAEKTVEEVFLLVLFPSRGKG